MKIKANLIPQNRNESICSFFLYVSISYMLTSLMLRLQNQRDNSAERAVRWSATSWNHSLRNSRKATGGDRRQRQDRGVLLGLRKMRAAVVRKEASSAQARCSGALGEICAASSGSTGGRREEVRWPR